MEKSELVQFIGNEVCEGCGPDRDCDLEIDDCIRISNAINSLDVWLEEDYKP